MAGSSADAGHDIPSESNAHKRSVSYNNMGVFVAGHGRKANSEDEKQSRSSFLNEDVETKKLVVVMVGLPARGKSHIAAHLKRYLNWIGYTTRVFNVGERRRRTLKTESQDANWFNPNNAAAMKTRLALAHEVLTEMTEWLIEDGGQVGIFDATNSSVARRSMVRTQLESAGVRVLFLESVCNDERIVDKNIVEVKTLSPDYRSMESGAAVTDFKKRIANYQRSAETMTEEEKEVCSFIKIIDVGREFILNHINGYLVGKIVTFLLSSHITPRPVYLCCPGETPHFDRNDLGQEPELSDEGKRFAQNLTNFFLSEFDDNNFPTVWTSQEQPMRSAVAHLPGMSFCWRGLDQLDYGSMEGLTIDDMFSKHPAEHAKFVEDTLSYRFPGGESFLDVIHRLEPIILEIERQRKPVMIVCSQNIVCALFAYFNGIAQDEIRELALPSRTVFKLTPRAYGCGEERFDLG